LEIKGLFPSEKNLSFWAKFKMMLAQIYQMRIIYMLKVILAFFMITSAQAKLVVSNELVDLLVVQKPFFIFPEDQSGLYQIEMAYADGCTIAFRDSLELVRNTSKRVKYSNTKLFELGTLDFAFIDYAQAPTYYRVYFGNNYGSVIDVMDSTVEDSSGVRILANRTANQTLIRFEKLEDAEKAWDFITNNMDKCRKK